MQMQIFKGRLADIADEKQTFNQVMQLWYWRFLNTD